MRSSLTRSVCLGVLLWAAAWAPHARGETATTKPARKLTDADFARHIERLRKENGALGKLTYVVEKPFVIAGDEAPAVVRKRAESTVRWAVRQFRKLYFPNDPDRIITIYLFGSRRSYEAGCKALTGEAPTTPFGFYSPSTARMVMNIATGGGTLVHELFHAFIPTNFPRCPTWINEGMASLYEQSSERNGTIVGLTNWRLAGLQRAIRARAAGSFQALAAMTAGQFYGDDRGVNYAQARYLFYYLQEKGLLAEFYRRARKDIAKDPTGYAALLAVLKTTDEGEFRKTWERFCMGLRFP